MSKKAPAAAEKDSNLRITDISAKIDAIVSRMESDDVSIEQSIELFEEGMALTSKAQKLLQEAEQRVATLGASAGSPASKDGDQ